MWKNIDARWLTLYLKLFESNMNTKNLKDINHLLPTRISKMGRAPSFGSYKIENKYRRPQTVDYIPPEMMSKLMGMAMEQAIKFIFTHFTYAFGGKLFFYKMGGGVL